MIERIEDIPDEAVELYFKAADVLVLPDMTFAYPSLDGGRPRAYNHWKHIHRFSCKRVRNSFIACHQYFPRLKTPGPVGP